MRQSYGNTWWGQQWLNALKYIDYSNRLPRGRTYANKGAVQEIRIDRNKIEAKVTGSRPRPYRVQISIPPFSANERAKIIELITGNPVFLSRLLNRELPPELNEACRRQDVEIFPGSWHDLQGGCSCPDWAVPCKHMAAVLYLVANEIDKNPFLVFELHDFDLFKGLEGVGYVMEGQKEFDIPALEDLWFPAGEEEYSFEWSPEIYEMLDFSRIPECRDQLLAVLSDQAVFFPSGKFKAVLRKAFSSIARHVSREAGLESGQESPAVADAVEFIEIELDETLYFSGCRMLDIREEPLQEFPDPEALVEWLRQIPLGRLERYSNQMRGMVLTFRLAEKLAAKSAFIPQLLRLPGDEYRVRWLPAYLNEAVWAVCDEVESLTPLGMVSYQFEGEYFLPEEEDDFPVLVSVFLNHFVESFTDQTPVNAHEPVLPLFFAGKSIRFILFENREYPNAIHLWLNRLYIAEKDYVPVLQIEDKNGEFGVRIFIEEKQRHFPEPISLESLFEEEAYNHIRMDVLRDLAMLSEFFPQISALVASRGREELLFDASQFVDVLFQILPSIRLFGIKVLLPKALRRILQPNLSMQLEGADKGIVQSSSLVSLENMLRFQWQVALGDRLISPEEFLEMARKFSGIVKLHDQYYHFEEKEVRALIEKLENPPEMSGHQLLQVALTEEYEGAPIKLDKKAQELLEALLREDQTEIPDGLKATLRPYQERGYSWLYKNARLGFGSLIADDMGLGKTLQVITSLLKLKEEGAFKKQKGLIIVPTTLLTNWEKEIAKFTPRLKVHLYHGPGRTLEPLKKSDLLLTTYGVGRSESAKLQKMDWQAVVIDEAQNIKNPATAQTKAIKKLRAPVRIAMSGTPVENRLSEYWSIFDFTNKGYLGGLKNFKENFAKPIEIDRDHVKLEKFRRITEPFIIRRVKTDKSIIQDLPDKIEKDQYCQLTGEQAALYQNVLNNTLEVIEKSDGINRRGLILKLITALKQVCNHPAHFLKNNHTDPALSGKARQLLELLGQILGNNEKTLIFTQYKEMGNLLLQMLKSAFDLEAPFLHGGVSRKNRDAMVEDFQHDRTTRIMLLSLKAGGTGLNLTAATNVIHYDLWWNPAVETQATDRAYRIGQTKNVMVHRFITQGTFEEKINQLLLDKKELADMTVASGEKWIGEMSNKELKELVKLE